MSGPPDQPQQVDRGQRVENSRARPAIQALRLGRCESGCFAHSRGPPKRWCMPVELACPDPRACPIVMRMCPRISLSLLIALGLLVESARAGEAKSLLGFRPASAETELNLERAFDQRLDKSNLRSWIKLFSARPHQVGSTAGKQNAERLAELFRMWGYKTRIETFKVLFPTPHLRRVQMVAPEFFEAKLSEPALAEDVTSSITEELLQPYHAYSADGDVTAPIVYVNYGIPHDYEILEQHSIDVRGKIVLARYGGSWRGIKPKVAAEHGAVGCLIYSDPRDDGYFQGDVYPQGAWRNRDGVQRGSVADMPLYPGDPLTPFIGATEDAPRLARAQALTLAKIPVLPLSFGEAAPILAHLKGPVAPEAWRGALPLTYHLGPGPAKVHLEVSFNWDLVPANDVIAELPGTEHPEQWIIRGNHHDAWVFGADDPLSGLVSLLEEARVIGELARAGSRPKRTVIFAAWDGEEPGLLGSTEWVETHTKELSAHAALYVNSDNNGRGFLRAGGSHSLEAFFNGVAADVRDPETGISVRERLRQQRLVFGSAEEKKQARERRWLHLNALGSGSDYTPFLQHLGIASLDLRYEGENGGGSYHSTYDSFDHYVRFGDPDFDYGIALAKTAGRALLRAANADFLPFAFSECADTYDEYLQELIREVDAMRTETAEMNLLIRDHAFDHATDPRQRLIAPAEKLAVPYLNFAPLQNALEQLRAAAGRFQSARRESAGSANAADRSRAIQSERNGELDKQLIRSERALVRPEGLPRRPWYRHLIYAPGFYTGYGVKTFPGVREAIEQRNWNEAAEQIRIAADALQEFASQIDAATKAFTAPEK